jgi:hypothetical protein
MDLPGARASVNTIARDGRFIASTEEILVPADQVAVQVNADGSAVTLIKMTGLGGRLSKDFTGFIYTHRKRE